MFKRTFAFLAVAFALFGTQCWAQACGVEEANCHTFSPNNTTFTYNFVDGSKLTVQFVTVLTTFDLRVAVSHPTNPLPLDPNEFPQGTVCVQYPLNATNVCSQYDFTGNAGGPHGVPVRNIDYKGLITLTLIYNSDPTKVHTPAFGHAPGDITTFTEDILIAYFQPPTEDGGMIGSTPGLSSAIALDEPLTETDSFCGFVPPPLSSYTVGQIIEFSFQLFSDRSCSGTPIRDKTATLSLAMATSCFGSYISSPPLVDKEEGNKFHWDNKDGLNEFDLSTVGLPAPGTYVITLFSRKFSPQSVCFNLNPAP